MSLINPVRSVPLTILSHIRRVPLSIPILLSILITVISMTLFAPTIYSYSLAFSQSSIEFLHWFFNITVWTYFISHFFWVILTTIANPLRANANKIFNRYLVFTFNTFVSCFLSIAVAHLVEYYITKNVSKCK